jgi:hypothetical protein
VIVPFAIAAGVSLVKVQMMFVALGSIAVATLVFAVAQPIRHTPLTRARWFCQGGAAGAASALAWVVVYAVAGL